MRRQEDDPATQHLRGENRRVGPRSLRQALWLLHRRELSILRTVKGPWISMAKSKTTNPDTPSSSVAGLLAWILPGLGHWYLGHRVRAVTLMVVIALTFWTGVAIGGVKSTVDPNENRIWFLAQICAGGHTVLAAIWSKSLTPVVYECPHCGASLTEKPEYGAKCPACGKEIARVESAERTRLAFWPQVDIAIVYTGIAGLLNLLVILDAIARAEIEPLARRAGKGVSDG